MRYIVLVVVALVLGLAPVVVLCQVDNPATRTIVIAGRLFDSEKGIHVPLQRILIRGGLIEAVGPDVATGARVLDLSSYTVLPGLIDSHTHLLSAIRVPEGPYDEVKERIYAVVGEGTAFRALRGAARARSYLQNGITTVRDLGDAGWYGDVALKRAINEGLVEGPRMLVSGPGLAWGTGQFGLLQKEFVGVAEQEFTILHGPGGEAADAVRSHLAMGVDLIKVYPLSAEELRNVMDVVRELRANSFLRRLKVAAHAMVDTQVQRVATAGVDSVEHGYQVSDSILALMRDKGIFLVPTDPPEISFQRRYRNATRLANQPQVSDDDLLAYSRAPRERLQRAIKVGVKIAFGSDSYFDYGVPAGEAAVARLLGYAEAGMPAAQILQSATRNAAELLGMEGSIGVIRPGAFADIIAIDGDPLQDIHSLRKIVFVMRDGTVYVSR